MRPYLWLRRWWRRAAHGTRLTTGVAVAIVIALVAWAFAPTGDGDERTASNVSAGGVDARADDATTPGVAGAAAPQAAPEGGGPGGATPSAPAPTGGGGQPAPAAGSSGQPSLTSGGPASPGGPAPGCLKPPGGTPGITDKNIVIGFGYANLAGPIGNSAVGLATPEEFRAAAQAVAADINARGGIHCRTVTLKIYEGNPVNQDQTQATCLQAGADRPFVFADAGAFVYPLGMYNCLPRQKVPVITPSLVLSSEIAKAAPYLASVGSDSPTAMRDVALGAKQQGFFDPARGFKKLGLLYDDCSPEVNRDLDRGVGRAGITSGQISKYVFACPSSGFAPPNEMSQAVAQFRIEGVTHVIPLTGGGSFKPFTEIANGQGFKPKYLLTDYVGIIITSASSLQPNPENFDRSFAISTGAFGQDTTPGFRQDPGTLRCQGILVKAGLAADLVFQKQGGQVCSVLWVAEAAIKNARALTREAALPGLFNGGRVQLAFPNPDATYKAPAKFFGGDTWNTIQWHRECRCWRILDPNRKPSFTA